MFDFFGIGARARVKVLEEALAVERARTATLTDQVIALSDRAAHHALHPKTPEEQRIIWESRERLNKRTIPATTNLDGAVAQMRHRLTAPKES